MAVSALTDEQTRQIRDYNPSLSNRPFGFDLADKLAAIITALNAAESFVSGIVSGTAEITSGDASIAIALDADHDGATVMAMLQEDEPGVVVESAVWDGSGNLTITLTAVTTANRDVGYFYVVGQ